MTDSDMTTIPDPQPGGDTVPFDTPLPYESPDIVKTIPPVAHYHPRDIDLMLAIVTVGGYRFSPRGPVDSAAQTKKRPKIIQWVWDKLELDRPLFLTNKSKPHLRYELFHEKELAETLVENVRNKRAVDFTTDMLMSAVKLHQQTDSTFLFRPNGDPRFKGMSLSPAIGNEETSLQHHLKIVSQSEVVSDLEVPSRIIIGQYLEEELMEGLKMFKHEVHRLVARLSDTDKTPVIDLTNKTENRNTATPS